MFYLCFHLKSQGSIWAFFGTLSSVEEKLCLVLPSQLRQQSTNFFPSTLLIFAAGLSFLGNKFKQVLPASSNAFVNLVLESKLR